MCAHAGLVQGRTNDTPDGVASHPSIGHDDCRGWAVLPLGQVSSRAHACACAPVSVRPPEGSSKKESDSAHSAMASQSMTSAVSLTGSSAFPPLPRISATSSQHSCHEPPCDGRSGLQPQLSIVSVFFGLEVGDIVPRPDGQGGWIPAQYTLGHVKTPAGAGVLESHLRESNSRPIHYE